MRSFFAVLLTFFFVFCSWGYSRTALPTRHAICPKCYIHGPDSLVLEKPGIFETRVVDKESSIKATWDIQTPITINYTQRILEKGTIFQDVEISKISWAQKSRAVGTNGKDFTKAEFTFYGTGNTIVTIKAQPIISGSGKVTACAPKHIYLSAELPPELPPGSGHEPSLLLENGDYLLLENGDTILLE